MSGYYACGKKCEKPLKGCRHSCQLICHEGICDEHCKEEVKVVCPCGTRSGKEVCWNVQQLPGYDMTKPVQIVLECDEHCKKQKQEKKEVPTQVIQQNQRATPIWLYVALLVLLIAVIMGFGLKIVQSFVCSNNIRLITNDEK